MIETLSTKSNASKIQGRSANPVTGAVGMLLLSVILGAIGQLMLKFAVKQMGVLTLSPEVLIQMASNWLLIFALAIYGVSACLWLLALMKTDLSFAYPFLSLTYIVVLIGSIILFNEHTSLLRLFGFGLVMCGLVIVTRDAKRTNSKPQG